MAVHVEELRSPVRDGAPLGRPVLQKQHTRGGRGAGPRRDRNVFIKKERRAVCMCICVCVIYNRSVGLLPRSWLRCRERRLWSHLNSHGFSGPPDLYPGSVHGAQVHQQGPVLLFKENVGGLQVPGIQRGRRLSQMCLGVVKGDCLRL